jgi:Lipocalin-like domain
LPCPWFSTYLAYCGRYEVEGDVVVHHIEMSLFPNWVGGDQRRQSELSGDKLVLRTPPMELGGDLIVNELRWIREE